MTSRQEIEDIRLSIKNTTMKESESGQGGATTAGRVFRALYCGQKLISHLMITFKTYYSWMINQGPIL